MAEKKKSKKLQKESFRSEASKPFESQKTSKSLNEQTHSKNEVAEITALLKKVQADFENFKKRSEKEKQGFTDFANQEFVKDLLPVLESFEQALKESANAEIGALNTQLWQILSSKGLDKIEAVGKKFDPFYHEALMQEESDSEAGTVIEELQAGYTFNGNVIRHVKVKVAK